MSDPTSRDGWWLASDGNLYPPEQHPSLTAGQPVEGAPPKPGPGPGPSGAARAAKAAGAPSALPAILIIGVLMGLALVVVVAKVGWSAVGHRELTASSTCQEYEDTEYRVRHDFAIRVTAEQGDLWWGGHADAGDFIDKVCARPENRSKTVHQILTGS